MIKLFYQQDQVTLDVGLAESAVIRFGEALTNFVKRNDVVSARRILKRNVQ